MLEKLWQYVTTRYPKNRSRTVRITFPFLVVAALLLSAQTIQTQNQSYISISTSPSSVREGEHFFITVQGTAHTPVNAVDVIIEYPEAQVEITGVDTGESVITLWAEEPYAERGKVYLRGGTFGKGFIGTHTIARIRAVATESGTAYVSTDSVSFVAGDGKGTPVPLGAGGTRETRIYIANEDGSLVGVASVHIVTDVDGDGDVDLADISAFMAAWFNGTILFDFNNDGRMTFVDFSILLADSFFK